MTELTGWIAVDLDGTLAEYHGWKGSEHIGAPIPLMVKRVKGWLAEGKDVRIFTARVAHDEDGSVLAVIDRWCEEHLGVRLPVTNSKDYGMVELWDDRCVQVIPNTGVRVDEPTPEDTSSEDEYFTCPSCGGHYFGTWSHKRKDGTRVYLSQQCHDQNGVGCSEMVILEATEDNPVTFQDYVDAKHPTKKKHHDNTHKY